jgi:hypothetical protein
VEIKINDHFTAEDLRLMKHTPDLEIIVDLQGVAYLTSNEISKMIMLYSNNKIVKFKNANAYIRERIKVLKIEDIILVVPSDD